MVWPWNLDLVSFKVIETGTIRKVKVKVMWIYSRETSKALRHESHSFTCKLHHACLYLVSVHQMALPLTCDSVRLIRKLGHGFLFAFHGNYGSILHHFRDKPRHWSKIAIFSYRSAFDALVRRGSPSDYYLTVWYGETRMVWLPEGKKSLAVSIEYRRVTDGQTDILRQHSPR